MNNNESNGFNYTYSAKEQAELKKIRDKYLSSTRSEELDKMEQILKLDAAVTKRATAASIALGIIGALVMGFGMSLVMTDFKQILGAYADMAMFIGILIGFVGMILVLVAYPLYQKMVQNARKKAAPEILRLTDELMNENK